MIYIYPRDSEFKKSKKIIGKGKLGAYAVKRVAARAHLPTPWLFERAKRPDDRADIAWAGI